MNNAPDPIRIILHLRIAVLKVEYFFSSVWLGVLSFYKFAAHAAEGRRLAQDLCAMMHGELRDEVTEETVRRLDELHASMRSGAQTWDEANPVIRFIVEPVRRSLVENCEILEDAAARLNQLADAEASGPEQERTTARESDI